MAYQACLSGQNPEIYFTFNNAGTGGGGNRYATKFYIFKMPLPLLHLQS